MRHVFSTCIHIRTDRGDFTRTSANARAFNSHNMVPMFAYQFRPRYQPPLPRARKQLPNEGTDRWRLAA